jgi:hypothetical protein
MTKRASTQTTWAVVTNQVLTARIEAHKFRADISRALKLIEESSEREHLYQVAGDLIEAIPQKLLSLEKSLDVASLALAKMGDNILSPMVPQTEKREVSISLENPSLEVRPKKADLAPPLGYPGGHCHVVDRVDTRVRNPLDKNKIMQDVNKGEDLTNQQASKVYKLESEKGAGIFRTLEITPHAQYRMDLRGITVPEVRLALASFGKMMNDWKSQKSSLFDSTLRRMQIGEYVWEDPKINLTVVISAPQAGTVRLVTTYWKGDSDPVPKACPRR